ncbi:MAG: D-alanyl-D-alanine carboxypeptidase [Bacilli bacterium]|nr:D-alanyl-D-alanine carboxypeptidase [Bacilli bacterium]MDD3896091.1 D-alanyl-D-alanine carboxypeptidase [Bacilli bacterium]
MKKIIILLLLLIPIKVNANELAKTSVSSILMEQSTGKVLYEKKSNEQLPPASMTKIMTLLLIMEALEKEKITLKDEVLITNNAASMGGSQVFLESGSKIKAEELLKSIAIASANDASVAMAEHIAGTNDEYVKKMNERCKELGCTSTNFMNVHGLDENNHYSSAKDMALITRELLKHEKILNYTSIYEEYLNKPDGTSTWMVNTNKLIKYYSGLDGLKTGFTNAAGYCLTATAVRNNMRLISVVMKSPTTKDRSNDTVELLNYGFSNFKLKIILDAKHDLGTIEILNGKKENVAIRLIENATNLENMNEEKKYTYNIITNKIKAPVRIGDVVGHLEIIENNKVINRVNITVKENINKANIWDLYIRNLNNILIGK